MSAQVYSVPGQTEGRMRAFFESKGIDLYHKLSLTCGDNVNYYKSVHHPIPNRENREHPGNKSVSSAFNWVLPFYFLKWNHYLYALVKSSPLTSIFLRFFNALVKIRLIPHVNFELTSQFLFNFCIIVMTHNSPVNFKPIHFQPDKRMSSRSQFGDFQTLWWKLAKFLISNFGRTIQFSFKLCINRECVKRNSSVLF